MKNLFLSILSVVVCHAAVRADEPTAERLFRSMQEKIALTKALKVNIEAKGNTPDFDEKVTFKLAMQMLDPGKLRGEFTISTKGMVNSIMFVCDGKTLATRLKGETKQTPMPPNMMAAAKDALGTPGIDMLLGVLTLDPGALEMRPGNSSFTLGAKEKIGDRDTQVVHYLVRNKNDPPESATKIAVWIDVQTNLPLKRICGVESGLHTAEVYDWQLDPKLDPKQFEIAQ